jgi:hypothetical protein
VLAAASYYDGNWPANTVRREETMASNDYHFISHWRVEGTVTEVADVLEDTSALARWWPAVYLDVQELEPGDAHGVGKLVLHSSKAVHKTTTHPAVTAGRAAPHPRLRLPVELLRGYLRRLHDLLPINETLAC